MNTTSLNLFRVLEELGDISPGNYAYLAHQLQCIGRIDLAAKLQPNISVLRQPASFDRALQSSYYIHQLQKTRQAYINESTRLTIYATAGEGRVWLGRQLDSLLGELNVAWRLDDTACNWEPNSAGCIDECIEVTLKAVSAYIKFGKLRMYPFPKNFQEMQHPLEQCNKHYSEILKALRHTSWNRQMHECGSHYTKVCPHTKPIRIICACLEKAFCFVSHDTTCKEIETVKNDSSILEAHFYTCEQMVVLISWLRTLSHLAKKGIINLRKHHKLITKIIRDHKDNINSVRDIVLPIVGAKVMEKVADVLGTSSDHEPESRPPIWKYKAVAWYVPILELAGFSAGCHVDSIKVGQVYMERFEEEFKLVVHDHYITSRQDAVGKIELCIHQGVSALLQRHPEMIELLPVIREAH